MPDESPRTPRQIAIQVGLIGAIWVAKVAAAIPRSPSGASPPSMRSPESLPPRSAPAAMPSTTGSRRNDVSALSSSSVLIAYSLTIRSSSEATK